MELGEESCPEQFSSGGIMTLAQRARNFESFLAIPFTCSFTCGQQLVGYFRHRADHDDRQALAATSDDRRRAIDRGGIFHGSATELQPNHRQLRESIRRSRAYGGRFT